jgi:hypothetical protein
VASPDLQYFARDSQSDAPLRSEIMIVRPMLPSDLTEALQICSDGPATGWRCTTTPPMPPRGDRRHERPIRAGSDLLAQHPAGSAALSGDLAAQIAAHAPEVAEALGFAPDGDTANKCVASRPR